MDDIKEPAAATDTTGPGSANIYNRQLMAADVADKTGLPRSKAIAVIEAVFDAASQALRDGKEVRIPSFGSFVVGDRPAGKGVDPATGAEIDVPESKSVRFRPGKGLRDFLVTPTV